MRVLFLLSLSFVVFSGSVRAQAFDIRAFSKQRGFKAYKVSEEAQSPRQKNMQINAKANQNIWQNGTGQEGSVSRMKQGKRIRQSGIKIFQEKDEEKVLNFDVENPEFKKLNEIQKKNLVQRIKIE